MDVPVDEKLLFCIDSDESEDENIYNPSQLRYNSSSSESEEEFLSFLKLNFTKSKRVSIENYVTNVVANYSEAEFVKHCRIKREIFEFIATKYESSIDFKTLSTNHRVHSAQFHVLVFLWYAGHNCGYHEVSDRFNISISTVHVILKRMTFFISKLSQEFIKWPNENRREEISNYYLEKKGFPDIIGCIDGTHIIIDPPEKSKDDYYNRKGQISLHVQGICDEKRKFIDIFVGYPGAAHDARVFKNSVIYQDLPRLCAGKYLLGDSAYPCSNVIITPYRDDGHLSAAQKNFNIKLSSCRVTIEHTFGILKQRFRQLYHCKLKGIKFICHFIRACCVLHNMGDIEDAEFFTEPSPEDDGNSETEYENETKTAESVIGKKIRDGLCQRFVENIL